MMNMSRGRQSADREKKIIYGADRQISVPKDRLTCYYQLHEDS
jgi:hypothetical protein